MKTLNAIVFLVLTAVLGGCANQAYTPGETASDFSAPDTSWVQDQQARDQANAQAAIDQQNQINAQMAAQITQQTQDQAAFEQQQNVMLQQVAQQAAQAFQ
jgi:hypothetical protein